MALPVLAIDFTEGDRLPALRGVVKDTDLTDCTVTLTIERGPDDVLEKEATFTLEEGEAGIFHFEWGADDIIAGIGQRAVIRLTDEDDLTRTLLRFVIDVQELPV